MVLPLRLTAAALLLACSCERASEPTVEPEPMLAPVELESHDTPAAEARAARHAPEQVAWGGVVLGLWPDECLLLAESDSARLQHHFEFPGVCHFALDADGEARVVMTDSGPVWIIESSKPVAQDCDTALRGVMLTDAGVRLSKAEQHVAMCAPGDWDEMMFYVFSSDPVELGTPGARP
jgi:hypothetical protein